MNLLLKIIDQSVEGIETANTIPLGEKGYYTLMNVDNPLEDKMNKQAWQNALDGFRNDYPGTIIEGKIVGFVYAQDRTYPILSHNVYYAVNSEGKTMERIYGQYNKY